MLPQPHEGHFCFSPFSTLPSSRKVVSKVVWVQLRGSAKGSTGLQEKKYIRTLIILIFSSHPFLNSISVCIYKLHNILVHSRTSTYIIDNEFLEYVLFY